MLPSRCRPTGSRIRGEAFAQLHLQLTENSPQQLEMKSRNHRTKSRRASAPVVVDLFAGAGGSAVGASMAGADCRLSVEIDSTACESLRRNANKHGGEVLEFDVSALEGQDLRDLAALQPGEKLIVVGGPPCQPFSKAAYWTDPGHDASYRRARALGVRGEKPKPITTARADDRRDLVAEFARLVIESEADGFVFENVPSILHPRNRRIFESLRTALEGAGYHTTFVDANSAAYGVPQLRRRVILMGARAVAPRVPRPTHGLPGESDTLPRAVSAGQAFSALRASVPDVEPEIVVAGRWARELNEIPPGKNYKALSAWAGHPAPVFEAETRFWSFLLKLHPDLPSWTVAANPGPWVGPFHWESRRLTTPELAALQSFPRGYQFAGSRRERVRQIGNAMPPLLAAAMIRSVMQAVEGAVP